MQTRDNIILASVIVFLVLWWMLNSTMDAAQAVGDARLQFKPIWKSFNLALMGATVCAAGLYLLSKLVGGTKKK